jgi:hypothetical protein
MESAPLRDLSGPVALLLLVSVIAVIAFIPAALLISGSIGVWTAVAIYLAATVVVTVASETLQRAVRSR